MLAIGRGLLSGGRILMMDEPSLGLAPIVIDQIYGIIQDLKSQGRTLLLVEENASRIIDQLESAEPAPERLILQSPGGAVAAALTLGRHLRARGIETQMLAGEFCYSACPYLLAGGSSRVIDATASVGVHQHYFGESSLLPAFVAVEDIQRGQGEVMGYLAEMGIDPLVMRHALATPPNEIYLLLPEELDRYKFRSASDG